MVINVQRNVDVKMVVNVIQRRVNVNVRPAGLVRCVLIVVTQAVLVIIVHSHVSVSMVLIAIILLENVSVLQVLWEKNA